MYKFVVDEVSGLGSKRKHAQHACDSCRKKRKRCTHTASISSDSTNSKTKPTQRKKSLRNQDSGQHLVQDANHSTVPQNQVGEESCLVADDDGTQDEGRDSDFSTRFVGDLSPEALFLASKTSRNTARSSGRTSVGVWLQRHSETRDPKHSFGESVEDDNNLTLSNFAPNSLKSLIPSLATECFSMVPADDDFKVLQSIYFAKVHPMWPIVMEDSLNSIGLVKSPWLKQAVSIMASTDYAAQPHLRLPGSGHILSRHEFSERLAAVVKTALDMGFITDKTLLVQVTALMSFYIQGTDGSEKSARYCSSAVHYAQNIGLQLARPKDGPSERQKDRLFFCVWALDRLNAAFNGRATLIHNWDIGMDLVECFHKEQVPSFRVFLEICLLLDKVIGLYRPVQDGALEMSNSSFLTFEEIVEKCDAYKTDNAVLASLELHYYAVAVLQCRGSDDSHFGHWSSTTMSQSFSASRISAIVADEFPSQLSMWAVTPYAVSLALSVAYRKLRNSRFPNERKRAHVAFRLNYQLLEQLGHYFWSAKIMAEIARKILLEIERIKASNTAPVDRTSKETTVQLQLATPNFAAEASQSIVQNSSSTHDCDFLSRRDRNEDSFLEASETISSQVDVIQDFHFDPTLYAGSPEFDIFSRFNPEFDLGGVDAVLQGNLDLSLPANSEILW